MDYSTDLISFNRVEVFLIILLLQDALSDTSEKKHRHSKTKKSSKDTQRKADVSDEYLTRDKPVKENKPERLPDQNDSKILK